MCGRYTLTSMERFIDLNPCVDPGAERPGSKPRYNIAPTQPVAAVVNRPGPDGRYPLMFLYWGLVPAWAKDVSIGSKLINARAETLSTKPAFKRLLSRRRCLIPADGFYEWQKTGSAKQPMWVHLRDFTPFALAGLWDRWHDPHGNQLTSCTVITCRPNKLMEPIHDRMPAIIPPEGYLDWLDPKERPAEEMAAWLHPYPHQLMAATPVARHVNNVKNDHGDCIRPLADDQSDGGEKTLF